VGVGGGAIVCVEMAVAVGRAVMWWCNVMVNEMEKGWTKGRRELRKARQ
jgi:hypothetical protein